MKKIYIIGGKRTPFGSFGGTLKNHTPVDLSVICSKALLEEQNIDPSKVDHVVFANVCPSTTDTVYAGRHLGLKLGMPVETPGYNVNRLCGSGIQAILDARRLILTDEAECVLATGSENMSLIPHLTYGLRFGTKFGSMKQVDMLLNALTDEHSQTSMGQTAENLAKKFDIKRDVCDQFSLESHQRAKEAKEKGYLKDEIVPIEHRKGTLDYDEHLREDANIESMAKLPPTFQKDGVVTAGSASGIVDGAASVLIASEDFVKKNNLKPLAEIIDGVVVGVDPTIMGIGPSPAITQLLKKNDLKADDIDLFEINEAFASQFLSCAKDLKLDKSKVNIWGGAIALGHPLGATGTRITLTLARQLKQLKKKMGIASACIGGGQGISILLKSHE